MESVRVFAPGSASNLGPGFDCLGIALTGPGDRVLARLADGHEVRVVRVTDPRIPSQARRNTAALAAAEVLRTLGSRQGVELELEKGLPLSGGLGGSAASAVAGAVAVDALLGGGLDRTCLIEAALAAESAVAGRHADNVAPALMGGGVLVRGLDPVDLVPIRVDPAVVFVLATPAYGVETAKARAVLPARVCRADAVAQAARLAALVLGLERGDGAILVASLEDRIAEPARASLYPGYPEARAAAREAGAFGTVVSGAGPTVVALADEGSAAGVAEALCGGFAHAGFAAEARTARVDAAGARIEP